jgi:hypothetical protein
MLTSPRSPASESWSQSSFFIALESGNGNAVPKVSPIEATILRAVRTTFSIHSLDHCSVMAIVYGPNESSQLYKSKSIELVLEDYLNSTCGR